MEFNFILPFFAGAVALICDIVIIRHAHSLGLIDSPNHRSSHKIPTPNGGGIGLIIGSSMTGLFLVWPFNWLEGVAVLVISCVLAAVSLRDDFHPLSAPLRLGIQALMGAALLFVLGGLPEIQRFMDAYVSRTLIYVFLLLVILWWINLFNFMDGIDGLAGTQAVFMLSSGAALLAWSKPEIMSSREWIWMLCVAGATGGFLLLNWSPAKIFMGDVGSIYLSFMILSFGLLSIRNDWIPVLPGLAMWAILGAAFVVDSTVTLLARVLNGDRWYEAHRSHVYQRLSRRLVRHQVVTFIFIAVNVLWLLPLAAATVIWSQWTVGWICLAYVPLVGLAITLGAGKKDENIPFHRES